MTLAGLMIKQNCARNFRRHYENDNIFAFKPKPDRFLSFFVKDKRIIVTNAFKKKTNKLPKNEKIRSIELRKNYLKRLKEGTYYGKRKK